MNLLQSTRAEIIILNIYHLIPFIYLTYYISTIKPIIYFIKRYIRHKVNQNNENHNIKYKGAKGLGEVLNQLYSLLASDQIFIRKRCPLNIIKIP